MKIYFIIGIKKGRIPGKNLIFISSDKKSAENEWKKLKKDNRKGDDFSDEGNTFSLSSTFGSSTSWFEYKFLEIKIDTSQTIFDILMCLAK